MTFQTNSLWEIIVSCFSKDVWRLVYPALLQTLYMVGLSALYTFIGGMIFGIILYISNPTGLKVSTKLYNPLSSIINALRSFPSMIMIIITLPLARLITGQGYGMKAAIIALSISCIPMYARLVENSLLEIDKGKIEACVSMGIDTKKILWKVVIPETVPILIRSFIVALIAIISMTAIAGSFGAGGLGNVAIQYGFKRFRYDIMLATVVVLVVMAQVIQLIGDRIVKMVLKKRHQVS